MTAQASSKPGSLFAALSVLQADLPKIVKGETAEIESKRTGKTHRYKYADLADVSQQILPRLSAVGLAFTSRPTLIEGQFVLAYSLIHVSGDREDGIYPLSAGGSPQDIGSAITYARRYCLCAVTGVAPDSDDDDAVAAEHSYRQSAGDVFESSTPARPRNSRQQGQVARPAAAQAAPEPAPEPARYDPAVPAPGAGSRRLDATPEDDQWYTAPAEPAAQEPAKPRSDEALIDQINAAIDAIDGKKAGESVWAKIVAGFNARKITPDDRRALEAMVGAKVSAVMAQQQETEAA